MDARDAKSALNEAVNTSARRHQCALAEAERDGLALGALAALLRDRHGQPVAQTANQAGIPAATLSAWMARAQEVGHPADDLTSRVLVVNVADIAQFVADNEFRVDRLITGRVEADVLAMSVLPLDAFIDRSGIRVPLMLAHDGRSGSWVGIDHAIPGSFGGPGPANVYRGAVEFGVNPVLAEQIAYVDHPSDLDVLAEVISAANVDGSAFPLRLPIPLRSDPTIFVADFRVSEVQEWAKGEATSAFALYIDSWLDALIHPCPPEWCSGPLHGRIYLTREAAVTDGFAREGFYGGDGACQLILERGRTQLWLSLPVPENPALRVTETAYAVLDRVGLSPERDPAGNVEEHALPLVNEVDGSRPEHVDMPKLGGGLKHVPRTALQR
ncbi:hypothetical protein ACXPWS_29035 [Mycobacterium sp. BMJ-28]